MSEWWESLGLLGQIFCIAAIPATVVMILQTILLFFGIGGGSGDADTEIDFDGPDGGDFSADNIDAGELGDSGLALFTVRGIVAFFAVGGWTGVVLVRNNVEEIPSVLIAVAAGAAALVGIALLYKYSMKLQDNGTLQLKNALGHNGTVYLTIPGKKRGAGKVTVIIQERLCEVNAMTEDFDDIKTNEAISVVGVIDDQTVMVSRQGNDSTINNKGGISKWVQK